MQSHNQVATGASWYGLLVVVLILFLTLAMSSCVALTATYLPEDRPAPGIDGCDGCAVIQATDTLVLVEVQQRGRKQWTWASPAEIRTAPRGN